MAVGGVFTALGGILTLVIQNISGTAPGTINIRVSVNGTPTNASGQSLPTDGIYNVLVPAGNTITMEFDITVPAFTNDTVTIENGTGSFSFPVFAQGAVDCHDGGGG
jgi:hypothetical protein